MSTIQIMHPELFITAKQRSFIEKLVSEIAPKVEGKTSITAKQVRAYLTLVNDRLIDPNFNKRQASNAIAELLKANAFNYEAHEAQAIERANRVAAPIGVYKHNDEIYRVIKGRNSQNLYAQKLVVIEGRNPRWEYAGGKIWELKVEELIDPEVAAQMGRARGFCVICGRYLTDETSVARGIGPICYERASIAYRNHPINN